MMQQLNHIINARAQQGFYVDRTNAGVLHRPHPEDTKDDTSDQDPGSSSSSNGGRQQVNMYFNVLLKRVMPLIHDALLDADGVEEQEEDQEAAAGDGADMSGAED